MVGSSLRQLWMGEALSHSCPQRNGCGLGSGICGAYAWAMKTPLRPLIGYVRVSTTMQGTDGCSLAAQRAAIEQYASAHGHDLLGIHEDVLSGSRSDRPGLQAALADAGRRKGILVCYSISRLGRSAATSLQWIEALHRKGGEFVSLSENIDTSSPTGRFITQLLASLAEMEREQLRERVRFAMAHQRKEGKRISRFIPYGWMLGEDGKLLLENVAQQCVLRRMKSAQMQGQSLRHIADELNEDGIATAHGGRWSRSSVYGILKRLDVLAA